MFKLETTEVWNAEFFSHFVNLKNELHKNIKNFLSEDIEDYAKFFKEDSPFHKSFKWRGFLVYKNNQVMAKAVLCWKEGDTQGNLGFLDWRNDLDAAKFLRDEVFRFAREISLSSLKTPIDINFFINFRVRLPTKNGPLYGEPTYPDYYCKMFEDLEFDVVGKWDVFQIRKWNTIVNFRKQRKKNESSGLKHFGEIKLRPINIKEWDRELEILYRLFHESYKVMADFEPLTYPQFKLLFDKFKYIANPLYSYIAELDGHPVGFGINYPDPQNVLKSIHGKKLGIFGKALALLRLRLNFGDFIIAHVGRIPGPNGEEIKGLQAKISKRLTQRAFFMRRAFTIQKSDALSKRAWDKENYKTYAQYVLYGKNLK